MHHRLQPLTPTCSAHFYNMDVTAITSKSIRTVYIAVMMIALLTSKVEPKSVSGSSSGSQGGCMTSLAKTSLYPHKDMLAMHPMDDAPYNSAPVPPKAVCPSSVSPSDPINRKTTCPYDYTTNYNRQRIPAAIPEARCLCNGCLDPMTGMESVEHSCSEIRYPMKVLVKSTPSPLNGFSMYSITTEDIAIGCTCVRLV